MLATHLCIVYVQITNTTIMISQVHGKVATREFPNQEVPTRNCSHPQSCRSRKVPTFENIHIYFITFTFYFCVNLSIFESDTYDMQMYIYKIKCFNVLLK